MLASAHGVIVQLFCVVCIYSRALSFARSVAELCCAMLVSNARFLSSAPGVFEQLFCVVRIGIGSRALSFAIDGHVAYSDTSVR